MRNIFLLAGIVLFSGNLKANDYLECYNCSVNSMALTAEAEVLRQGLGQGTYTYVVFDALDSQLRDVRVTVTGSSSSGFDFNDFGTLQTVVLPLRVDQVEIEQSAKYITDSIASTLEQARHNADIVLGADSPYGSATEALMFPEGASNHIENQLNLLTGIDAALFTTEVELKNSTVGIALSNKVLQTILESAKIVTALVRFPDGTLWEIVITPKYTLSSTKIKVEVEASTKAFFADGVTLIPIDRLGAAALESITSAQAELAPLALYLSGLQNVSVQYSNGTPFSTSNWNANAGGCVTIVDFIELFGQTVAVVGGSSCN